MKRQVIEVPDDELEMGDELVRFTVEIVTAQISSNPAQMGDVPGFIKSVHAALTGLAEPEAVAEEDRAAVPIINPRKSVFPDHLVCLECGKRCKVLKSHLKSHKLDEYSYRVKYGLPASYPMVAADFAELARVRAKSLGLGAKGREAQDTGIGKTRAALVAAK